MKYHNFILQPGYAEDVCLCTMSVSHNEGFEGIEEAIENLRLTIIAFISSTTAIRPCCRESAKNSKFNYCPRCGANLGQMMSPDAEDVEEFFMELPMTTLNEGADMLRFFEDRGWHLGGHSTFPDEAWCSVWAVARWMSREDTEDVPYLGGTYPDGEKYSSHRQGR